MIRRLLIFVFCCFISWGAAGQASAEVSVEADGVVPAGAPSGVQGSQTVSGVQTISIDDCHQMALSGNAAAVQAELSVKAARYQKAEAFTEYFPRVSAMGFGYISTDPLLNIGIRDIAGYGDFGNNLQNYISEIAPQYGIKPYWNLPTNGYGASLSLLQPVFAGGRIITGNKLASVGVEAAQLQQKVQQRKTIEEIDDYFWQTVSLEQKMQSVNEGLALVDSLYKDASSAVLAGLLAEEEFRAVSHKRKELLFARNKLRSGIKLSKMNLLSAIGVEYEFLKLDSIVLIAGDLDSVKAPSAYYANEESIASSLEEARLLDLNVESKVLLKKIELGAALPQIGVGAMYGYADITGRPGSHVPAFATAQIPISDWWKTSIKMKRLQTDIDKAATQRDHLHRQLLLLVRKTWVDLCSAWDDYSLALESTELARESLQRVKAKYAAGLATMSDVLSAQSSLSLAAGDEYDALASYRKALQKWLDFN